MSLPRLRFRLRAAMVVVAIVAALMAEIVQRRERLARLSMAQYERAYACSARLYRPCSLSATPGDIEAYYRKIGPPEWLDYQTAVFHVALASEYDKAANRPWFPMLADLPPSNGFREIPSLAEWGLEALLEATPIFGVFVLVLFTRSANLRRAALSPASRQSLLADATRGR